MYSKPRVNTFTKVSEEHKKQIEIMYFGPYEPGWYINGKIQNGCGDIAKRLDLKYHTVSDYITKLIEERKKHVFNG